MNEGGRFLSRPALAWTLGPMVSSSRTLLLSVSMFAALVLLVAAGGAAEENGNDVYTTIDVNFHHLGDHFVPTYQPQSPEGTEYNKEFEISG